MTEIKSCGDLEIGFGEMASVSPLENAIKALMKVRDVARSKLTEELTRYLKIVTEASAAVCDAPDSKYGLRKIIEKYMGNTICDTIPGSVGVWLGAIYGGCHDALTEAFDSDCSVDTYQLTSNGLTRLSNKTGANDSKTAMVVLVDSMTNDVIESHLRTLWGEGYNSVKVVRDGVPIEVIRPLAPGGGGVSAGIGSSIGTSITNEINIQKSEKSVPIWVWIVLALILIAIIAAIVIGVIYKRGK
jgi:hypothetical protein